MIEDWHREAQKPRRSISAEVDVTYASNFQACEDCTTVSATFKLLEGFEGVLDRPLIAADLHVNHLRLLTAYAADLGAVSHTTKRWQTDESLC